jgi:sugar/nucleoside kinase (ribokinase family)
MLPDRAANDLLPVGAVSGSFGNGASTGAADAEAPTPGAPRGGPAWVHLSGYALIGSGSRAAGRAALRAALAHGCPVSIDAASSGPLADVGAAAFLDWCDGATVLLANDDEAAALGGVRAILTRVSTVVVKHGRAGATWTDGTDSVSVPGQVVEAADSTGAGDAFAAGWIRARLAGRDRREALLDAVAVATRAVAKAGARP